jgi:hypothetical protein
MNDTAVTRDEWKLHKMPKSHATIPVNRRFSASEIGQIKLGFRPEQMEDRWIIFYEREHLYIHRSWTGYCIYVVRFDESAGYHTARQIQANRNPKQYGVSDDSYDSQMAFWVIDFILLKRNTEMPQLNSSDC